MTVELLFVVLHEAHNLKIWDKILFIYRSVIRPVISFKPGVEFIYQTIFG